MTLTKKTTHVEEALANLIGQYRDSTVLRSFIDIFVRQIQDLENAAFEVHDLWLDNATGVNLDNIGSIVNEARKGRDDDTYRDAIRTRVYINIGNGTPEEIYTFMNDFNERTYQITDYDYAAFFCRAVDAITGEDPAPIDFFLVLRDIKPAGVRVYFHYALYDDTNVFTFATGDTVESDSNRGFANDAQTSGGYWSEVIDQGIYDLIVLGFIYLITDIAEFLIDDAGRFLILG